ncbi:MAG: hypothetical protein NC094_00690 [Bacteroidales bacterium]|nr:hypothetical protein [Lachnoclostridium sp.]MCM1383035.1 hypothetical protein [Lachnoclostridium sp.]MCM1463910.1 hypothetical protein [Bacteroidales bacterium]
MKKKVLTLLLAAVMTFSLAACGEKDSEDVAGGRGSSVEAGAELSGKDGKDDVKDGVKDDVKDVKDVKSVEDPMGEALKNMNSASNMEAEMIMEMDMKMSAGGETQTIESVTEMHMTCFYEPTLKIKMEMDMDMKELGSQKMEMYAETAEDGSIMTYIYDGQTWQSQVAGAMDLEAYDARRSMSSYIQESSLYTLEGMEEVNGANAYKYSYAMTGDEMKETILNSGSLDSLASLGLSESQMEGMMDGLGELVTYVWVDEETLYPVKYEMDMTEIMDKLMSNMVGAMGEQAAGISMSIPKMTMSMTCSDFGTATDFSVPEEAKHTN